MLVLKSITKKQWWFCSYQELGEKNYKQTTDHNWSLHLIFSGDLSWICALNQTLDLYPSDTIVVLGKHTTLDLLVYGTGNRAPFCVWMTCSCSQTHLSCPHCQKGVVAPHSETQRPFLVMVTVSSHHVDADPWVALAQLWWSAHCARSVRVPFSSTLLKVSMFGSASLDFVLGWLGHSCSPPHPLWGLCCPLDCGWGRVNMATHGECSHGHPHGPL